jgi:hypothetical protein
MMPPKIRRRIFALFDEGAFAIDCYYLGLSNGSVA